MLKPEELEEGIDIQPLEDSIDAALKEAFKKQISEPYKIYIKDIQNWSPGAWHILKSRYKQYWTIEEHPITGSPMQYLVFSKPEFSMIERIPMGDH